MRRFYLIPSLVLVFLTAAWMLYQQTEKGKMTVNEDYKEIAEKKEMTMKDFMENYVELAETKFKKGNKEPMKKMLEIFPFLALSEDKEEWELISKEVLASGEYLSSCKTCHTKFKKSYKKLYKKRLISIPKEILELK